MNIHNDNIMNPSAAQQLVTIADAAKRLGVSTKTLRRWEKQGKIIPQRTTGNQRRYSVSQIEELRNENGNKKSESSESSLNSIFQFPLSKTNFRFPISNFHFLSNLNAHPLFFLLASASVSFLLFSASLYAYFHHQLGSQLAGQKNSLFPEIGRAHV